MVCRPARFSSSACFTLRALLLLCLGFLPAAQAQQGVTIPDSGGPQVLAPSANTQQVFVLNGDSTLFGAVSSLSSSSALRCLAASGFTAPTPATPVLFEDRSRILYYAGTTAGGAVQAVGVGAPVSGTSCSKTPALTLAGSSALRVASDAAHSRAYFLTTLGSGGADVLTAVNTSNAGDYASIGSISKANQVSLGNGGTYTAMSADSDGIGLVAITQLRTETSGGGLWVYSPGFGKAYKVLSPDGTDLPAVNAFIIPNPKNNGGSLLVLANQDNLSASNLSSPPLSLTIFTIIDLGQLRDLIGTTATASSVMLPFVTYITSGSSPYAIFGAGYDPVTRKLFSLQATGTSSDNVFKNLVRYDPYNTKTTEILVASLRNVPLTYGSLPKVVVNGAAQTMQLLTSDPNAVYSVDISYQNTSANAALLYSFNFDDANFAPVDLATNTLAGETYIASSSGNIDVLTLPSTSKPAGNIDIIAPQSESGTGTASNISLLGTFPVIDAALSSTNITVTATAASSGQSFTFATIPAAETSTLPYTITGSFPAVDTYTLVASFPGDSVYRAFTSAKAVVAVGLAPNTTSISVTANQLSDTSAVALVTLTGTTYAPTGTITLTGQSGAQVATYTLSRGLVSPISIPFTRDGFYVTATYSGDASNSAATSALTEITAKSTTTTIITAPANATTGVAFNGTVTINSSGIAPPSGFSPTANTLITATQVGGTATLTIGQVRANLAYQMAATVSMTIPVSGTWKVVAHYPGDTYFLASDSAPVIVTVNAPAPAAAVSTPYLNFTSPVGTPSSQNFTLTNSGSATLNITSITSSSPSTFALQNACGSTLAVGASCTVGITFTPGTAGNFTGTVSIASDASNGTVTVALTGATPVTTISLTPSSLTFNAVLGDTAPYQDVKLLNTGNQTVTISSIATNNAAFTQINGCPGSLSPGFQCTIRVNFSPTNGTGQYIGRLNVTDNASGSPQQVALTGNGTTAISFTSSLSPFPNQTIGTTSVQKATLTLSNNSASAIAIPSSALSDNMNFEVITSTCATPLAAGDSCIFVAEFHPVSAGQKNGTLSVAASTGSVSVLLAGVGLTAGQCIDTDGDSLCDDWETLGYIARVNNKDVFVDLPHMGADPKHKDIFLHIDWMATDPGIKGAHKHWPLPDAMRVVVTAFSSAPVSNPDGKTGINLHVDCGGCLGGVGSINKPYTIATSIAEVSSLDPTAYDKTTGAFSWSEFDKDSKVFNDSGRSFAFHHVLFAHDQHPGYGASGISRNASKIDDFRKGASDLIVSLGSWKDSVGTYLQQGGTLMHELGHNLSLQHGGRDENNYKPQYLSVMNYSYQTSGLYSNGSSGSLDYSEWALPVLDERKLNETTGLGYSATTYPATGPLPAIDKMGFVFYCPGVDPTKGAGTYNLYQATKTNFDCDKMGTYSTKVASDANGSGALDFYPGYTDWDKLVFSGGAVGGNGVDVTPLASTLSDTYTQDQESLTQPATRVTINSPGVLLTAPGSTTTLRFVVTNTGALSDAYALTTTSDAGWAGASVTPAVLTLASGASAQVTVTYTVPANAPEGASDSIVLTAQSSNYANVLDAARVLASATASPAPLTLSVSDINFGIAYSGASSQPRMMVLTNTSASALTLPSIATSAEFAQTNTCGGTLAAGAGCVVTLTFSPASIGSRTGTLSITSSASPVPLTVALLGNGSAAPLPRPGVTLTATPAMTSTGQRVTLSINVAPPSGNIKPSGTVTITNGDTTVAQVTLDANGNGTFTSSTLAAGTYDLLATYSGDTAFLSANAPYQTLTIVNAAPSTVALTASASAIPPGGSLTLTATVPASSGSTVPTGTVNFFEGSTMLGTGTLSSSGVATFTTTTLTNGTHSLTASYAGDAVYASSTSAAVSITVGLLTPAVSLSSSAASAVFGSSITFSATVSASSGTPAGSVTFLDGATVLGSGALSAGVATYATAALAIGTHSITAQYAASGIYAAATSAPKSITITGVPDYSVTASPASLTITHGSSGTATFTVTPVNGYTGTVRFTCGSVPANAQCTFAPTQLAFTASSSPQTSTLTIDTTQHVALLRPALPNQSASRIELASMLFVPGMLALASLARRRRKLPSLLLGLLAMLATAVLAAGCASSPQPATVAPGTYTLVITTTDGATNHAVNFNVTVN